MAAKRTTKSADERAGVQSSKTARPASATRSASASERPVVSSKRRGQPGRNLLLRDLDPDVLKVLQERAKRAGRSLQQELHIALARDARRNFDEARAISSEWRERLAGKSRFGSTELIREDRDR